MITELAPAGAERSVFNLATRLDREKFDVHVLALRGGAVADWLAQAEIPTTILGVRSKWDIPKLYGLVRYLREGKFDILHTHLFHADFVGRLGRVLAGGPEHLCHTVRVAEMRFRPWQFAFARLFANSCDRIITVSNAVQDHHARCSGLPPSRYLVIPNGTDIRANQHDPKARRRMRHELGIPDGRALFAFIGRLDHQKGLDVLLEAIRLLHTRSKDVSFVIAGDGPQRDMLEKFLKDDPARSLIHWLGFTDDVRSVLSAADALVLPSRWEGLPNSALEAMAAGLSVIAARVPGPEEVVIDGVTGILIENEDARGLADSICKLTDDKSLRQTMGSAGLRRVRELYSIERTISAHEKLYKKIIRLPT